MTPAWGNICVPAGPEDVGRDPEQGSHHGDPHQQQRGHQQPARGRWPGAGLWGWGPQGSVWGCARAVLSVRLSPLCSSAPQDLQQVMVSGPNLNETSIVSGGYGGTAEGIIPTGTIKGNGAGLGGKGDHHGRKGLSSPYCPPLMTQGSAMARPRCLLGGDSVPGGLGSCAGATCGGVC